MGNDREHVPDDLYALTNASLIQILIVSYGAGHNDPPDGDALDIDLRDALRNPPDDPAVRDRMARLTGLDEQVRRYVLATPGAHKVIESIADRAQALFRHYYDPRLLMLRVHIRCQGGRHRSVAVAEEVAVWLRARGVGVEVEHRHIDRPLLPPRPAAKPSCDRDGGE
jgi:RNase adaptor protein for sRNA GlmZ degradation